MKSNGIDIKLESNKYDVDIVLVILTFVFAAFIVIHV